MLTFDYIGTTSQFIIKKECFDKVGMFDTNIMARKDYEICIRISMKYDMYGVDDYLFYHTIHDEEQISKNYSKIGDGLKKIL